MAIHRWSARRLAQTWVIGLGSQLVLILMVHRWAASYAALRVEDLAWVLLAYVAAWSLVPFGLVLVSYAWYWSRRRVRESAGDPPAI